MRKEIRVPATPAEIATILTHMEWTDPKLRTVLNPYSSDMVSIDVWLFHPSIDNRMPEDLFDSDKVNGPIVHDLLGTDLLRQFAIASSPHIAIFAIANGQCLVRMTDSYDCEFAEPAWWQILDTLATSGYTVIPSR